MLILGIIILLAGAFTYFNLFVAVKMVDQARKDEVAWKSYWESTMLSKKEDSEVASKVVE